MSTYEPDALNDGQYARYMREQDAAERLADAIDEIESEIKGDLLTFQRFAENGVVFCDMGDLWESLTQALGDLEAPKSIRDARAAFDETFSRVCREQAEELAPAVLELRQHRIREDV